MMLKRMVGAAVLAAGAVAFSGALAHAAPEDAIPSIPSAEDLPSLGDVPSLGDSPLPQVPSPSDDAEYEFNEPLPPLELGVQAPRAAEPDLNPTVNDEGIGMCGNPLDGLAAGEMPSIDISGDCDSATSRQRIERLWDDCTDVPEALYAPAVVLGLTPLGCYGTPTLPE